MFDAVRAKSPSVVSAVGSDGWGWNDFSAFLIGWFEGLADSLGLVEETGTWPDDFLDAYIVMLCLAFFIVCRLWAKVRLGHGFLDRLTSWIFDCEFSGRRGRSSVAAWFSTALDVDENLGNVEDDYFHIFVADVAKKF